MKKIVAVSLLIFVIVVLAILALNFIPGQGSKNYNNSPIAQTNNSSVASSNIKTFTLSEISKHNNSADCWLLISGKVYDVSKYLARNLHPGENMTITPYCGKEASGAFKSKGNIIPNNHSKRAWAMLADYYVGDLAR